MQEPSNVSELHPEEQRGYRTATEYAALVIRERILNGSFPDGMPLRQDELAKKLDLSRMPVREALRQLEAEGLVDFQPRKGAVVATLSPDDIVEIYELRAQIEPTLLRLSIPNLTESALQEAELLQAQIETHPSPVHTGALNLQFHLKLYSGVERQRTKSLLTSLNTTIDRYLRLLMSQLGYSAKSDSEHRALLACCRARDIEGGCAILSRHLLEGGNSLANFVRDRHGRLGG
jgi:DNA-binding GntR family transcriptional regulator